MERWEPLGIEGYGIYQDESLGRFTEDPVRLVHFMRAGVKDGCADLGTGNGIIALYANALYGCRFTGIDTDGAQLSLARRSAEKNGQAAAFLEADVSEAPALLGAGRFSVVTANPPYFHGGTAPEAAHRMRERHNGSAEPFIAAAAALLKNGGRFYICYPAAALASLSHLLISYGLQPKRAELSFSRGRAKLVLLEAKKGAAPGLVLTERGR